MEVTPAHHNKTEAFEMMGLFIVLTRAAGFVIAFAAFTCAITITGLLFIPVFAVWLSWELAGDLVGDVE